MSDLAPRHRKLVEEWTAFYRTRFTGSDTAEIAGYLSGWQNAVKLLWPDAESLMGQDPMATDYVLRTLAIEAVYRERVGR